MRRSAGRAAVLAGLPILILGLAAGTAAAASGGGTVTNYPTGTSPPSTPFGTTAGPNGALWFTNSSNDSIGRITTSGTLTSHPYTDPSINDPLGITAGPNGALWFTNGAGGPYGTGSIGEITTSGKVYNYTSSTGIDDPEGITAGRTGTVVHQQRQRDRHLDRADHHLRDGHQSLLHRHRHRRPGVDHGRPGRGTGAVLHQLQR